MIASGTVPFRRHLVDRFVRLDSQIVLVALEKAVFPQDAPLLPRHQRCEVLDWRRAASARFENVVRRVDGREG